MKLLQGELMKVHEAVIEWHRQNPKKGVWMKCPLCGWCLSLKPDFEPNIPHVENDIYAFERKAAKDSQMKDLS